MKTFNVDLYRSNILWHEFLDNSLADIIQSDEDSEELRTELHSTFDYEKKPGYKWHIHLDVGITIVGVVIVFVRSSFEFKKRNTNWDELFSINIIQPLLSNAIQQTFKGLHDVFRENSIELPAELTVDVLLNDEVVTPLAQVIIDKYFNFCKQDDLANEKLINVLGLNCTMGYETSLVLKATFVVLDEVLFDNLNFDRAHNREVFCNVIPEPKYHTLKLNCFDIDNHRVKLSFLSSVLFLTCLDCALQILISDKADLLFPVLDKKGLTPEARKDFFRCGTDLFNTMNISFQTSNIHISNLEQKYEWYKLIR